MVTAVTDMAMDTGTDTKASSPAECPQLKWFPLRVTYSRELKVRDMLRMSGFECFVPMTVREEETGGVKRIREVPAVNNLCFVRAGRKQLDEAILDRGMSSIVSYIWNRSRLMPESVPDKAMADFIRVSESRMEDIVYLLEVNSRLRAGQRVRIKDGPFAGVVGKVVRIRRSRRVMVELPGMLAVATGYIPEDNLEIV